MTPRPIPRTAYTKKLGRFIRTLRTERGWSQRELARQSGVSGTTVLRLERGDAVLLPHVASILTALRQHIVIGPKDRPLFTTESTPA
ncbi:MAG: helix-turn-helix transcriptional regulator [Elusimicrobia bacterium]|nr:helix-turn-helix transcriptional regulator [Elusimicrobiota bacterium]